MDIALVLSLVLLLALGCQWLAWRVQVPAILFLLLAGLALGPGTGFLNPDEMFQELLMPIVSLSVAIILFEGSLSLKIAEVRELGTVVQRMVTIGALLLWVMVAGATYLIFGFPMEISALFGALMVVTGPTVIVPMLNSVRPTSKIANALRWEGIIIDPIGALFAVVTYEFIVALSIGESALARSLLIFGETVMTGMLTGIIGGYTLGYLLKHHLLPEYLQSMATLAILLAVFSVSNVLHHESGLLAVTVMGMYLGNQKDLNIAHILNFKENLTVLLISLLFILLAARIDFAQLLDLGWQPVLILVVIQLIARPLKVWICTLGSDFNWRERALLAWIAPRGIVAAAISAIFAERLLALGYEDAAYLVPLTFWIIIGTVVLQSATAKPLAFLLGVMEPPRKGYLIVGANAFARQVAVCVQEAGYRAVVTDSNWDNIRLARMAGLETYYGNPVTEHAERYLDLSGLGGLLLASPYRDVNAMAAVHFRSTFGANKIYGLNNGLDNGNAKFQLNQDYVGRKVFDESLSYSKLASLTAKKHSIRFTTLSETFNWEAYREKNSVQNVIFTAPAEGELTPWIPAEDNKPGPGSRIFSLQEPEPFEPQGTEATQLNS
ncbi:MAG: NhaP-type Na+/H+ or K+/H+ antiporter [Candidatus Azotimanducaceae bacterium]|jgi:NhaP-type Na+/H+ or K+/H+ antiporter